MHSSVHNNVRVITISSAFRVTSNLDRHVSVALFALPLSSAKVRPDLADVVVTKVEKNQAAGLEPLLFWKYLSVDDGAELSDPRSLVHYILVKEDGASDADEKTVTSAWSCPMRVKISDVTSANRQNVTLPLQTGSELVEVSSLRKDGVTYLSMSSDESPNVELHNNTEFDLLFGQSFVGKSLSGDCSAVKKIKDFAKAFGSRATCMFLIFRSDYIRRSGAARRAPGSSVKVITEILASGRKRNILRRFEDVDTSRQPEDPLGAVEREFTRSLVESVCERRQ